MAEFDIGFDGVDGILGYVALGYNLYTNDLIERGRIGPTGLTDGKKFASDGQPISLLNFAGTTSAGGLVPTVTDNLFELGIIGAKQVGVSFEPTTTESITNGELTFGGVDTSKFSGTLHTL